MEISWQILVFVAIFNSAWIGLMFFAQQLDKSLPPRLSIIPGTNQKFLYIQDFWTMTVGDFIGVALINTAFAHLAVNGCLGVWHWLIFSVLVAVLAIQFGRMCMSQDHKPDYGFPDIGNISSAGILHLPYFGNGVAAGAFCLWFIITGDLRGPVMYIGLGGGALYALCIVAEIKSGNFDPLKRIQA
jgi:predicted small integral membrane protein